MPIAPLKFWPQLKRLSVPSPSFVIYPFFCTIPIRCSVDANHIESILFSASYVTTKHARNYEIIDWSCMACLTALVATYKDTTTDAITAAFISAPPSSTIVIIWFRRGNFHPLGGIFYVPLLFLRRVIAEYECITPYAKCMPSSNLANPVNVHKLLLDIVLFFSSVYRSSLLTGTSANERAEK